MGLGFWYRVSARLNLNHQWNSIDFSQIHQHFWNSSLRLFPFISCFVSIWYVWKWGMKSSIWSVLKLQMPHFIPCHACGMVKKCYVVWGSHAAMNLVLYVLEDMLSLKKMWYFKNCGAMCTQNLWNRMNLNIIHNVQNIFT